MVDLPCPTTVPVSVIYLRSLLVLSPCLGSLSGVHSKPEKKTLELVGSFTSSRLPKLHCSTQIVSRDSSMKLLDIRTLSRILERRREVDIPSEPSVVPKCLQDSRISTHDIQRKEEIQRTATLLPFESVKNSRSKRTPFPRANLPRIFSQPACCL